MIGEDFLLAYKALKAQRKQQKDLARFIGKDPTYAMIESSVKSIALMTRTDLIASWTFPNGTKLEIKKSDAYDRFNQNTLDPERRSAY